LNGKVFEFRTSLELLSQPDGLGSSSRPSVAGPIPVLDGDLPAFQAASPTPSSIPYLATQPEKLGLQLIRLLAEHLSDVFAQFQKRID
jgi:hypothetical protein